MDKIFNDLSGRYTTLLCIIGDRLDLFKKLEKYGPITSQDFAQKSNTSERYAKEWLNGLTCAQYKNTIQLITPLGFQMNMHMH